MQLLTLLPLEIKYTGKKRKAMLKTAKASRKSSFGGQTRQSKIFAMDVEPSFYAQALAVKKVSQKTSAFGRNYRRT